MDIIYQDLSNTNPTRNESITLTITLTLGSTWWFQALRTCGIIPGPQTMQYISFSVTPAM